MGCFQNEGVTSILALSLQPGLGIIIIFYITLYIKSGYSHITMYIYIKVSISNLFSTPPLSA